MLSLVERPLCSIRDCPRCHWIERGVGPGAGWALWETAKYLASAGNRAPISPLSSPHPSHYINCRFVHHRSYVNRSPTEPGAQLWSGRLTGWAMVWTITITIIYVSLTTVPPLTSRLFIALTTVVEPQVSLWEHSWMLILYKVLLELLCTPCYRRRTVHTSRKIRTCCVFRTLYGNIIIQYKPTKCALSKLIF